jgi:hypothetical protein
MNENIIDEKVVRNNNLEFSKLLKSNPSDVPRLIAHVPGCINIIGSCYDMRQIIKMVPDMCVEESYEEKELEVMFGDFFIRSCCGTFDICEDKVRKTLIVCMIKNYMYI